MRACWIALVLGFLAAASPAAAQAPVSGTVLGPEGLPMAGARVELRPLPSYFERGARMLQGEDGPPPVAATETGAEGRFSLSPPRPGIFLAEVRREGFLPMRFSPLVPVDPVELPAVRLTPSAGARITVRGRQGAPRAGIWVYGTGRLDQLSGSSAGWRMAPRLGRTDAAGRVVLPSAPGERLAVTAFDGQAVLVEGAPVQGDIQGDAVLTAREGSLARRLLEVRDPSGKPVPDILVEIGDLAWPVGRTGEDGRISLAVPEKGSLRLSLLARDGRYGSRMLENGGENGGGQEVLQFRMPGAAGLGGRVADAASRRPVAGALVWDERDPGAFQTADSRGRYRLPAAGTAVGVQAAASGYLPRSRKPAGGRASTLDLFLDRSAVQDGWVVDAAGEPLAGVQLEASPLRADSSHLRAVSAADGRFSLAGLDLRLDYELKAVKKGFASAGLQLHRVRRPLRIALFRLARGMGRIVDPQGRPVAAADVRVTAVGEPESGKPLAASTDADGRFEVADLPASGFDLAVRKKGYVTRTVRNLPAPVGTAQVDLGTWTLDTGWSLEGMVTDGEKTPLSEARVWVVAAREEPSRQLALKLQRTKPAAVTGPAGTFFLSELGPEEEVRLLVWRRGYLAAWRRESAEARQEPVIVALEEGVAVGGRVVNESGEPVARARVTLRDAVGSPGGPGTGVFEETLTGPGGEFLLQELAPGSVSVSVTAEEYAPVEPRVLDLQAGRSVEDLFFMLERGVVLRGSVRNPAGEPVAGAAVTSGHATARSQADGSYRLGGLAPGLLRVEARHPSYRPLVKDLEAAAGLATLDLSLEPGLRVAGRVVRQADGLPVGRADLKLAATGNSGNPGTASYRARSAEDGGFTIEGVAEGRYELVAEKEGYFTPQPVAVDLSGGEASNIEAANIEVVLRRAASVAGRVLGLDAADLPNLQVEATGWQRGARKGTVRATGEFEIEGVEPGRWTLRAWLPEGGREASAAVEVRAEEQEVRQDLEFGDLTVSGRATQGDVALAEATVALTGLAGWTRRSVTTDAEGGFRIADVPRGRYLLSLTEKSRMLFYSRQVAVEKDQRLDIDIPAAALSGRVVSSGSGAPLAGAVVQLSPVIQPGGGSLMTSMASASSDANGLFGFPSLAAGRYRLTVRKSGFQPLERVFDLGAGTRLEKLDLPLSPGGGEPREEKGPGR